VVAASPDADIRWQQRFSNDQKALAQLETFFDPQALNDREQQGLIKAFETTFELAWNTLRELGPALEHADRLRLMAAIEELLLPWQVDLTLKRELPADLQAHVDRVGLSLGRRGD
jgi:hypothetical protein